jgi:hypothetical protein
MTMHKVPIRQARGRSSLPPRLEMTFMLFL